MALLFACLAPSAHAGDTYVLDIARDRSLGIDPGIVELKPDGAQRRLALNTTDPNVQLPLEEPVDIDVIETTGKLLITDAGSREGYKGSTDFGDCGKPGCGALLEVNPENGKVTLLAGPGGPGTNRLANPYGVLVRPQHGDALVTDPGTARIVSVDLQTGIQTLFSKAPYPGGFRSVWGLAEDPTNGDVLVANPGVDPTDPDCTPEKAFCALIPSEYTVPVAPQCAGNDGFVLRLSADGVQKQLYCDDNFRRPRDVLVNGDGTIFVVDPITQVSINPIEIGSTLLGFGGVFQIEPATGQTQLIAAGEAMATSSGLDFNAAGTSLLLADETLHSAAETERPPAERCENGCGGVIGVVADGGAQTVVSSRTPQNGYVDPIALAVDRDQLAPPALPVRTVPYFFRNLDRPEGKPTATAAAITALPFVPVRGESRVVVLCVEGGCTKKIHRKVRGRGGKKKVRTIVRPRVEGGLTVPPGYRRVTLENLYLHLELCPEGKHKQHDVCVWNKAKGGKAKGGKASLSDAVALNRYVAIVAKQGFIGRYQAFTVVTGAGGLAEVQLLPDSGCLLPGEEQLVSYPMAKKRKKGKKQKPPKPRSLVTACPNG